jgi:hypothetical protein
LENLGAGTVLVLAAAALNAETGWYLVRTGRRNHSLILEANGKAVLTDNWTSFGVIAGLGLVMLTKCKPFDPLLPIAARSTYCGQVSAWCGGGLSGCLTTRILACTHPRQPDRIKAIRYLTSGFPCAHVHPNWQKALGTPHSGEFDRLSGPPAYPAIEPWTASGN